MSIAGGSSKIADRLAQKCRISQQLVEDAYACTDLQASLVVASLHDMGDYTSQFIFDVSSASNNPDAWRSACEHIREQTPILRSRVIETGGQFLQVITHEPLRWLEANDLDEYLVQDKREPVVLGQPLARFAWIREANGKLWMVWSLHHCQYDGWSFKMMVDDLNLAASQATEAVQITPRPPFSKFIKALSKIDSGVSHAFWESKLQNVLQCRRICANSSKDEAFRTNKRYEKSAPLRLPADSVYQPGILAVAAWSLLLSHLSASSDVLFGHVVNGRTFDLEGIQEICGPTIATIPWPNKLSFDRTVQFYLEQVLETRSRITPFEQTGLLEFRKVAGLAAFETLLSLQHSQSQDDEAHCPTILQPEKLETVDLSHPCCIFLELDFEGDQCRLKAYYDDRWVDIKKFNDALDKFVLAMEKMPQNLQTDLRSFERSLELPSSIVLVERQAEVRPSLLNNDTDDPISISENSTLQKIRGLVAVTAAADVDTIGPDTTLMQLGMDSLKMVVFSRNLSKAFHASIPFRDVTGPGRTLLFIEKAVTRALHRSQIDTGPAVEQSLLEKADSLMRNIRPMPPNNTSVMGESRSSRCTCILLTGATGYLGIEILRQCLATDCSRIVALVRCVTQSDGMNRIERTAQIACWKPHELAWLQKVDVWPSDLAQACLGLSDEHWQVLSDPTKSSLSFKAIIHNGAKVDFLQTYSDLEAANVRSTAMLLDQCCQMPDRPNFVFVTGGRPCPLTVDEIESTARKLASSNGYAQTKFVSELLIHKTKAAYGKCGQSVYMSIVHPGAIIGSSSSGVANTDDFLWRYVAASASIRHYVPAVPTRREWINLTPVDCVASSIVSQALTTEATPLDLEDGVVRCLIRMGLSVSHFWAVVNKSLQEINIALEPASEWEWLQALEVDLESRGEEQPLFSLSQLMLQGHLNGIGGLPPVIHARRGNWPDTAQTEAALRSNVLYLVSRGYFARETQLKDVFARNNGREFKVVNNVEQIRHCSPTKA